MDIETVYAQIEKYLGKPVNELFATFSEKALGSASIAQVHRATLKDGTVVAVKVRRPGDSGGRAYAGLRPALYNIAPQPGQHGRCRGLPYRGDYRIPCKHLLRLPPVWEDEERQSDKVSVIKCFMTTVRIVEIKIMVTFTASNNTTT